MGWVAPAGAPAGLGSWVLDDRTGAAEVAGRPLPGLTEPWDPVLGPGDDPGILKAPAVTPVGVVGYPGLNLPG